MLHLDSIRHPDIVSGNLILRGGREAADHFAVPPEKGDAAMKLLPMPPRWSEPLPNAMPPADMALYQLPTGTYETRAAFAVKGGEFGDKRPFAATPALVMHPKGDLLVDAGFGSHVADHLATLPWYQRPRYT